MLWTIIVILIVLWLLGFIGHVGGSLIHLLLVIAVVVLIINLIQGKRAMKRPPVPGLAIMFRLLAVLEFIGGYMMCASLWPGEPPEGHQWKTVAYEPALTWLMVGVISGCLFLAIAKILIYLSQISDSLAPRVRIYNSGGELSPSPKPEKPQPPPLQLTPEDLK